MIHVATGRRFPIVLFSLLLLSLLCEIAYAQNNDDKRVIWQTTGASQESIRSDFSKLFAAFRVAKKQGMSIPTKEIITPSTDYETLKTSLLKAELYGGVFPDQILFLTCELNKSVCSVETDTKGNEKTIWQLLKDTAIKVPDISVLELELLKPYNKSKGETIESIVVTHRQGCKTFDEACKGLVKHLNGDSTGQKLQAEFSGTILVPTKGYAAVIPAELVQKAVSSGTTKKSSTKGSTADTPSSSDSIKGNIVSDSILPKGFQAISQAGSSQLDRKTLLDLISYQDVPDGHDVIVGVLDGPIDVTHCFFDRNHIQVLQQDISPIANTNPSQCGTISSLSPDPTNHGMHVAGLVSSMRRTDGWQGINPEATLAVSSFDPLNLIDNASVLRASVLLGQLIGKAGVINLSWDYEFQSKTAKTGTFDPIASTIRDAQNGAILIVVAAGNYGIAISGDGTKACKYLPACMGGLPNVLTVTALSNDKSEPHILADSKGNPMVNYGDGVHLGVPADGTLSTIWGNQIGAMTGTSQAAPVAAGAASLLLAKRPTLAPIQIKNRLIYTSDLFDSLNKPNKNILGGRLNVARALKFDKYLLLLKGGKAVEPDLVRFMITIDGKNDRIKISRSLTFVDLATGDDIAIRQESIKRMTLKHTSNIDYYEVFYVNDEKKTLKRFRASLQPGFLDPQKASFFYSFNDGTPSGKLPISDIEDYVAPIAAPNN